MSCEWVGIKGNGTRTSSILTFHAYSKAKAIFFLAQGQKNAGLFCLFAQYRSVNKTLVQDKLLLEPGFVDGKKVGNYSEPCNFNTSQDMHKKGSKKNLTNSFRS